MKQNKKNISVSFLLASLLMAFPVFAQWQPGQYAASGLPASPIYMILQNLMFWLLAIFGFVAVIGFVISGIQYLTAAGDEDQQGRAKKAMYYSIMGVIVGLGGLVILNAVTNLYGSANPRF